MATFMTRVELHDASYSDYEELHVAMETEGFDRNITSDDGVTYYLPPAEYYCDVQLTRQQVLEKAKRAARTTQKSFSAVVTESKGIAWTGLSKVGS
jgi:hypothetical protein